MRSNGNENAILLFNTNTSTGAQIEHIAIHKSMCILFSLPCFVRVLVCADDSSLQCAQVCVFTIAEHKLHVHLSHIVTTKPESKRGKKKANQQHRTEKFEARRSVSPRKPSLPIVWWTSAKIYCMCDFPLLKNLATVNTVLKVNLRRDRKKIHLI